jgi:hypothetical protein
VQFSLYFNAFLRGNETNNLVDDMLEVAQQQSQVIVEKSKRLVILRMNDLNSLIYVKKLAIIIHLKETTFSVINMVFTQNNVLLLSYLIRKKNHFFLFQIISKNNLLLSFSGFILINNKYKFFSQILCKLH